MSGCATVHWRCENIRCHRVHRVSLCRATAARLRGADPLRQAMAETLDERDRARDSEKIPADGWHVCACGYRTNLGELWR
jgi:hypothetical protein